MEVQMLTATAEPKRAAAQMTVGRLFFLEASVGGGVVSVNADVGGARTILTVGSKAAASQLL
jgi:hypothetical protein